MNWRQLRAILLLPGLVLVGIPLIILLRTRDSQPSWGLPLPWSLAPFLVGLVLIGLGLHLMAQTIHLFTTVGQGTLAPWDATQRLVVRGPYR